MKKNLVSWIKQNEKIEVILNGIDEKDFQKIKKEIIEFDNLETETKRIAMTARFIPPKDYETVVLAAALLPKNIKFIFIGIGEEKEKIEKLVKYKKLEERIKFLGYREDVRNIMASVDLNILSSANEGFGLVLIESIFAGVPVLGANVDGINEIITDSNYLFKYKDYKELAQKIQHIVSSNKNNENFEIYRKEIKKKYNIEKMTQKYQELYLKLLNKI